MTRSEVEKKRKECVGGLGGGQAENTYKTTNETSGLKKNPLFQHQISRI